MLPNFDAGKTRFNLENAYVLIRASQAAYAVDNDSYFGRLAEIGIDGADQKWFTGGFDAGFLAWTNEFVLLTFRGTDNPGGWVSNLFGAAPVSSPDYYGKVHPGFADAVNALWSSFYPELAGPLAGRPLFVSGHSRGGAIATLAAQALVYQGITAAAVYTFGSPRVGNAGFANRYDIGRHFRIENDRDIVPHVPPRPMFRHVGDRYWLTEDATLEEEGAAETPAPLVLEAAFADSLAGGVGGLGPAMLGGVGSRGLLDSEFFSDHASTEYAYWLWKQLPDAARTDAGKSKFP